MARPDVPRTTKKKTETTASCPPAQQSAGDVEDFATTSASISRQQFIQKHILAPLEDVNKQTALAPLFSGVSADGDWLLKLKSWKNHDAFKSSSCSWRESKGGEGGDNIHYGFNRRHQCRYMNDVDDKSITQYSVDCVTKNTLSVLAIKSDELPISLVGETKIAVSSTKAASGADLKQNLVWSASATISWSAQLNVTAGADGLRVELVPAIVKPDFQNGEVKYASSSAGSEFAAATKTWGAIYRQIQEESPSKVDFGIVMSGLRKVFGDCWKSLHVDASMFIDAKFAFARNGAFSLDTRSKVIEAEAELEDDEEDEGESETFDSRGGDGIRVRGFTSTKAKIIQDEGALPEYNSIFGGGRAKGKVQTRVYEKVETHTSPSSEYDCRSPTFNFGEGILGSGLAFGPRFTAKRTVRVAKQSRAVHSTANLESNFSNGGGFGSAFGGGFDDSFAFGF